MNARRRPYPLAAVALSCAFAVPHMAYAQDEPCDGIDNDQDGTVDETCDCADRFVEPENRNLSIFRLGSHDDGRIVAYGANDFFELSAQGVTRTEAPGRLLVDANGLSVTLRAARAYVTENGVEREIGRSTIRDASRVQIVGTRFETALALVRRVPVAISSATSIPRIRGRIESVAGDARAFVAWARDGTVHHVDGLNVRTTQIPGVRVRAMLHRAANDVFVMSESALLHFDGTAWTTVLTTTTALPFVGLTATGAKIYLLARRESVGGGVLHLVEGATHTTFDLEPTTSIWSLCAAPFGLYATDRGALVRWDGHAFVRLIDTMPFEYEAIDGSSPTDVVAVGDGAVVHYDGRTFRTIHHEPGRSELSDVFVRGLDDYYVVGHGEDPRGNLVLACTRAGCRRIIDPARFANPTPMSVWSDGTRVLVGGLDSVAELRDGSVRQLPIDGYAYDIAARADGDVYVVGSDHTTDYTPLGVVWRYDGTTLRSAFAPVSQQLETITFGPGGELFAAGGNGALHASEGTILVRETNGRLVTRSTGGREVVTGIQVIDGGLLLVGETHLDGDAGDHWGNASFVLRHAGPRGVRAVAKGTFTATDLFATSARNVFIVGRTGALIHRCGPTALDTLDTPERVVHRGNGFPARD